MSLDAFAKAHAALGRPNRHRTMGVVLDYEPAFGEAHVQIGRARNGLRLDMEEHILATAEREAQAAFAVQHQEPALPAMNKGQRARLAEAQRLLASDFRKDRARGAVMLRALTAERTRQLIWREEEARLDHTIRLAEARGEVVDVAIGFGGAKTFRIKSHDGLTSLFEEGALTGLPVKQRDNEALAPEAWARAALRRNAGTIVRGMFEAEHSALRSQMEDRTGKGGDAAIGPVERAFLAARARAVQVDLVKAVMAADPRGRALSMLKLVVGEGRTLTSINPNGNPKEKNLKALILGLDVAAIVSAMPGAYALLAPLVPAAAIAEIDRQRQALRERAQEAASGRVDRGDE